MTDLENLPGIECFERWLAKRAQWYTEVFHADYEDFIQEGRIGLWKGMTTFKPGSVEDRGEDYSLLSEYVGWVTKNAEWHWKKIYRTRRWTGMPSRYGQKVEDLLPPMENVPLSFLVGTDGVVYQSVDAESSRGARDHFEDVDYTYHREEIFEAIRLLPPTQQKYVYESFWEDKPIRSKSGGAYSTRKRALVRLSESLPHLKDLVTEN